MQLAVRPVALVASESRLGGHGICRNRWNGCSRAGSDLFGMHAHVVSHTFLVAELQLTDLAREQATFRTENWNGIGHRCHRVLLDDTEINFGNSTLAGLKRFRT